jgi:NADH-quinone oxidoreductase subunit N
MIGSFQAIGPMACIVAAGIAAMVAEAFRNPGETMPIGWLGIVGLLGAAATSLVLWNKQPVPASFGVVVCDNFGLFVTFVLVLVGILTIAFSAQVIERDGLPAGEYYALTLFALAGMMLMALATDLLVIFLALEVLSLGVYVLTGIRRQTAEGTEAAFKYFLLGAFSSAFFLYGIAFTYGVTGSTRLDRIGGALAAQSMHPAPLILIAMALLLVGFAFKISAVPFHMWTPDAYQGAPAIVTGFMSTGVKAAAFASFVRVFLWAFEPLRAAWVTPLSFIAAATMILGTVVGVTQTNIKRMLAYSSIAHGGYMLVALVAANEVAKASILFYLLAYAVTNLGAFGVIALIGTAERPNDELTDYAGLWNSRPVLAGLMTVFLLSLGGFPPTVGFVAKWYVFSGAVRAGYLGLAIIGVLTSVISVFFYLRVVVMMYMSPASAQAPTPSVSRGALAVLSVSVAAIFYLGILPTRVLDLASSSIATMYELVTPPR